MARVIPVTGEIYHVYNRGVEHRAIFDEEADLWRFAASLYALNCVDPLGGVKDALLTRHPTSGFGVKSLLRRSIGARGRKGDYGSPLVRIIAYHLLPNHFHLLLEQMIDGGVSEFMKRIGGYTKYFNEKYERGGVLFQGKYKCAHIHNNEHLQYLLAYVCCNDVVHEVSYPFERSKELVTLCSARSQYEFGTNGICDTSRTQEYVNNVAFWEAADQLAREIKTNRDLDRVWLE
jgi:hypothetical protein